MRSIFKKFFLLIYLLLLCDCCGMMLRADELIYRGDTLTFVPYLLSQYVHKVSVNEADHEEISRKMRRNFSFDIGYISIFEIRNDSLFLLRAYGKEEIDLSVIFGKSTNVFVDWYSGTATGLKNLIIFWENYYGGYYEYETDFYIEKGVLKKVDKFHNTIKKASYGEYKDVGDFIKENIDYDNVTPISNKVRVIVRIKDTDINGKITDAEVLGNRGGDDTHSKEALRVIKSISQWEVLFRRGKSDPRMWTMPVNFELEK